MAMERDRDWRPEGEPDEENSDDLGWYFDLPGGAWERQEAKNRQLRDAVRGNLQDEKKRLPPLDTSIDPPEKKGTGGLFGRKKRPDEPSAPRETAGGTYRLNRGGAPLDGDDDAPNFGDPEPREAPSEPSTSLRRLGSSDEADSGEYPAAFGWTGDTPGGRRRLPFRLGEEPPEPREPLGLSRHEPDDNEFADSEEGDPPAPLPLRPRGADSDPSETTPSRWAEAFSARPGEEGDVQGLSEALERGASGDQGSSLLSWARKAREQSGDDVEDEDKPERWKGMFGASADGGNMVDSMRQWASGPEGDEDEAAIAAREARRARFRRHEEEDDEAPQPAEASTPHFLVPVPANADDDWETEPTTPAALSPALNDDEADDRWELPKTPVAPSPSSTLEETDDDGEWELEPTSPTALAPSEPEADDEGDWDLSDFAVKPPVEAAATDDELDPSFVTPAPAEIKKKGLFGRLFGKKKEEPAPSPEVAPAASAGEWEIPAALRTDSDDTTDDWTLALEDDELVPPEDDLLEVESLEDEEPVAVAWQPPVVEDDDALEVESLEDAEPVAVAWQAPVVEDDDALEAESLEDEEPVAVAWQAPVVEDDDALEVESPEDEEPVAVAWQAPVVEDDDALEAESLDDEEPVAVAWQAPVVEDDDALEAESLEDEEPVAVAWQAPVVEDDDALEVESLEDEEPIAPVAWQAPVVEDDDALEVESLEDEEPVAVAWQAPVVEDDDALEAESLDDAEPVAVAWQPPVVEDDALEAESLEDEEPVAVAWQAPVVEDDDALEVESLEDEEPIAPVAWQPEPTDESADATPEWSFEPEETEAPAEPVAPVAWHAEPTDESADTTPAWSFEPEETEAPAEPVAPVAWQAEPTDESADTTPAWSFEPEETEAPAEPVAPVAWQPEPTDESSETTPAWNFEPEEAEAPAEPVAPVAWQPEPTDESSETTPAWNFEPEETEAPAEPVAPVVAWQPEPTDESSETTPAWSFEPGEVPAPAPERPAASLEPAAESDDPWAGFFAGRREDRDGSPLQGSLFAPQASAPDAPPPAALTPAWSTWQPPADEEPPASAANGHAEGSDDDDDPWGDLVSATGYDRPPGSGEPGGATPPGAFDLGGSAPEQRDTPRSGDPQEVARWLDSALDGSIQPTPDVLDTYQAPRASQPVLGRIESELPPVRTVGDWEVDDPGDAGDDQPRASAGYAADEEDVVLRAFEAHASTPIDDELSHTLGERGPLSPGAGSLNDLLGDDADAIVDDASELELEERPFSRLHGFAPQRSAGVPVRNPLWTNSPDLAAVPEIDMALADAADAEGPLFGSPEPVAAGHHSRSRTLIREIVETALLALLVFLSVRASFQNFKVDGTSMYPTLEDGQFLIVNKLVYSEVDMEKLGKFVPFVSAGDDPERYVFHPPERGDIIVLRDPADPKTDLIKRIIALPGETVEIRNGQVYINDYLLEEPYITTPWHGSDSKILIPADHYYVLGDHRDNSKDSRNPSIGLIPKDLIIGKAMLSYWPSSKFGLAPNESGKLKAGDETAFEARPTLTTRRIDD